MNDGKTFFAFVIGQIVFLGIMTIVSIIKQKGKKYEEKNVRRAETIVSGRLKA
ncbi:MAG: hypothetical protein LBB61_06235 [Treponema sp.]|jgi:hypothetical protein|nr:hypothetical protein [Treponema sp.]